MREIKFRAFSTDKVQYYKDFLGNIQYFIVGDGHQLYTTDIIQLYTGLKDKNGKEIYEGDVVKTPKGITTVTFDLGCFYVETCSKYRLGGWDKEAIEVIGNIYEDPKLLSKQL